MFMSSEFINSLAFVSNFRSPNKNYVHEELQNIKLCVSPETITLTALNGSCMAHRILSDIKTEENFSVLLSQECVNRILKEGITGELIFNRKEEKINLTYGETIYTFLNPSIYYPDTESIIARVTDRPCKLNEKHGVCILSENFELLHKAIKIYNKTLPKREKDSSYKMWFGDSDSPIRIEYKNFLAIIMPCKWNYYLDNAGEEN